MAHQMVKAMLYTTTSILTDHTAGQLDADVVMASPDAASNDILEQLMASGSTAPPNAAPIDVSIQPVADMVMASPNVVSGILAEQSDASELSTPINPACINIAEQLVASEFLTSPSQSTLDDIISRFIDATGNAALETVACGSCAREMNKDECKEIPLKDIPKKHHLLPHALHPAHELVNGLLIYAPALGTSKETMYLCDECRNQLEKDVQLRLSLSNGMWVGDVPRELQNLTLPEQLLIAKYYTSAYIIKLFPKQKNKFTWDCRQMHSAMKGNVSTYRLDPHQVAGMIDGKLFPPPAKILSATIGITFVGPKGLRESTMPAMFRVRRWRIREALLWLKANNPIYSDIEISEERLFELPEDGIPEELIMTAKHSADMEVVEREHEGYVPADLGDNTEGKLVRSRRKQLINLNLCRCSPQPVCGNGFNTNRRGRGRGRNR